MIGRPFQKRHIITAVILSLPFLVLFFSSHSLGLFSLDALGFLRAPLGALGNFYSRFNSYISPRGFYSGHLKAMDLQMKTLQAQNCQFKEILYQNQRLRELLDFKQASGFKLAAVRVVSRDPTNWRHSIIIDKGTKDGVRKNMFLISRQGLIGRVCQAGRTLSCAILLTDPDFKVSGIDIRSREQMIITGSGLSLCYAKYLDKGADIQKKDIIATSGLGGFCPKGIIIGEVVKAWESSGSLSMEAMIKPQAGLNTLEEVFVLLE